MRNIIFVLLLLGAAFCVWQYLLPKEEILISNFEECLAQGYLVLESYPRQCKTPGNESFTEYIGNELEKMNLIRVSWPRPNESVKSPILIKGEARGYWFFEADFPVRVYDENGKLLGTAIAQAESDWMTEDFVSFSLVMAFGNPETKKGTLVLEKDNPSDIPEFDDQLIIPINFAE
ncbi:MAG: Gmad2 immunoglobulin-like domain-containing protein [Candidatus Nealsonbacteria bacterium]